MNVVYWLIISLCLKVLELEGEKGEWGFKALKQMMKLNFRMVRCCLNCWQL